MKCQDCNHVKVIKKDHDYEKMKIGEDKVCSGLKCKVCGHVKDIIKHDYEEMEKGEKLCYGLKCKNCNHTKDLKEHELKDI